ncbi:hypothetical protein Vafri_20730 [Volvox africanus]|uniref:Uncharacterized protein n=1 Tax=Volvox africanus TaxID=51714 RepID=A0A8J4FAY1_9CHLO|nr:hypothetical protein Vafri_20730 [Volvox africanus]
MSKRQSLPSPSPPLSSPPSPLPPQVPLDFAAAAVAAGCSRLWCARDSDTKRRRQRRTSAAREHLWRCRRQRHRHFRHTRRRRGQHHRGGRCSQLEPLRPYRSALIGQYFVNRPNGKRKSVSTHLDRWIRMDTDGFGARRAEFESADEEASKVLVLSKQDSLTNFHQGRERRGEVE